MSCTPRLARNILLLLFVSAVLVSFASASGPYQRHSKNTVTADPNVTRPATTPCVVQLFSDAQFFDFNVENFNYAPPADCPGPWAKVVLEADISLNAGIQFDRTANFWLGPVNIYFGTTAEPSTKLGPSWHIENDLTDYSAIFYIPKTGQASIGNTLCCGLTSTIFASASLEFYPLAEGQSPPVTADQVLGLSAGDSGGTVALNTPSDMLSGTFTFPLNVQAAYLDVYAQGQSNDEFWYTCAPNDVASELQNCGSTGFRETEITIDGQLAGVAPVFPWIFTGGIDPFLWFPLPGVQTLNFTPYRVNLTPFAGLLSDGLPHTIALSVLNADSYFSATASLLVYRDPDTPLITGAITQNTLAAPSPVVTENLNVQPTFIAGTVNVSSNRNFVISGYINTSRGKVTTKVGQNMHFLNHQKYKITGTEYIENLSQATTVAAYTKVSQPGMPAVVNNQNFSFPLLLELTEAFESNGGVNVTTIVEQTYQLDTSTSQAGQLTYTSSLTNAGQHADTLELDSSFNIVGNTGQSAAQQYNYFDSTGAGSDCALSAANNKLKGISPGCTE